ncbi:hypothetical protein B0A49_03081, partial [Cryomyces minteri]
ALLPVVRNCFDRDPEIAPRTVDEAFGSLVERDGKFAKRVVFAVHQMFGIEFAPEVVQADGNVKNLAWRICNAKKVLRRLLVIRHLRIQRAPAPAAQRLHLAGLGTDDAGAPTRDRDEVIWKATRKRQRNAERPPSMCDKPNSSQLAVLGSDHFEDIGGELDGDELASRRVLRRLCRPHGDNRVAYAGADAVDSASFCISVHLSALAV